MSTSPTTVRILEAAEAIGAALLVAVADGRVTADEGAEILRVALAELHGAADDFTLADVGEFVGDLLARSPEHMRVRADRLAAEGKVERAERLRARADRVEARQAAA